MNPDTTKKTPEQIVQDIVWQDEKSFQFHSFIAKYIPASGISLMGSAIVHSYLATGRADLLFGGLALAALGLSIIDISSGKGYLSKIFSRVASFFSKKKRQISQPEVLASFGLAACGILGGGELYHALQSFDGNLLQGYLNGGVIGHLQESASGPKILANLTFFLTASAMDIPIVYKNIRKILDKDNVVNFQNALGFAGSFYIIDFATKADLPLFVILGGIQGIASMAGILGWLNAKMHPHSFFPLDALSAEDKLKIVEEYESAAKDCPDAPNFLTAYHKELHKMYIERGHFSEKEIENLSQPRRPFPERLLP